MSKHGLDAVLIASMILVCITSFRSFRFALKIWFGKDETLNKYFSFSNGIVFFVLGLLLLAFLVPGALLLWASNI